jgi:hypothetical protein
MLSVNSANVASPPEHELTARNVGLASIHSMTRGSGPIQTVGPGSNGCFGEIRSTVVGRVLPIAGL